MADRNSRLNDLKQAVHDYVDKEKTRIGNEVKVLKAILDGRTAGAGIQASSTAVVAAVAQSDLNDYLKGAA